MEILDPTEINTIERPVTLTKEWIKEILELLPKQDSYSISDTHLQSRDVYQMYKWWVILHQDKWKSVDFGNEDQTRDFLKNGVLYLSISGETSILKKQLKSAEYFSCRPLYEFNDHLLWILHTEK